MSNKVERRYLDPKTAKIETRAADEGQKMVSGIPILYNVQTILYPGIAEIIERGAAAEALEKYEAYLLWQHRSDKPMASYKNETLTHEEREDGVYIEADCSKTSWGRDGYEAIENRLIDKMSFGFIVADQEWEEVENQDGSVLSVRHIKQFDSIYDFAPVTYPAYADATIAKRSLEHYQEHQRQNKHYLIENDMRRRKLHLINLNN